LPGRRIEHDLREREDRLLRAERRNDAVRVDRCAEPAADPAGDRLAELGDPRGSRIAHALANAFTDRLDDPRVGRLAWVAHAEVDHLEAAGAARRCSLVQADERVRRLRAQDRRDGHVGGDSLYDAETNRCSVAEQFTSAPISTCSSRRWAKWGRPGPKLTA